jgi:putative copper export protein
LNRFAEWLAATPPSVYIQNHNAWFIPLVQSVHIVGIAVIIGSVLMINLRILGFAGTDQTLRQTSNRFAPWVTAALYLLLVTGILMVIGEPVRELVTFSFWLKMFLVALSTVIAVNFQRKLRADRQPIKWLALATFVIWAFIIILGRLIAYDHVWGSWSPATKA